MLACLIAQLCPTLCDPMDCSPAGSSVHGILQARMLEWVAIPFSRGSFQPRDQTQISYTAGKFFPWFGKFFWRRKWQPTPVSLAWRIPWTEEPDGVAESATTEHSSTTQQKLAKHCKVIILQLKINQKDKELYLGNIPFPSSYLRKPLICKEKNTKTFTFLQLYLPNQHSAAEFKTPSTIQCFKSE